jgi:uncharacterized glyoxalase superfamily protein PhnB
MAHYKGIVSYLFYDAAEAAMKWYTRVFGFEEIGRWTNADGKIHNAEMRFGDNESAGSRDRLRSAGGSNVRRSHPGCARRHGTSVGLHASDRAQDGEHFLVAAPLIWTVRRELGGYPHWFFSPLA